MRILARPCLLAGMWTLLIDPVTEANARQSDLYLAGRRKARKDLGPQVCKPRGKMDRQQDPRPCHVSHRPGARRTADIHAE